MDTQRQLPEKPIDFILDCIGRRAILWTYHVNMRLQGRHIPRELILGATETFEILESYPDDKYLPSYLVYAKVDADIFHILFAADVPRQNVRVVTAYRPNPAEWSDDLKRRLR